MRRIIFVLTVIIYTVPVLSQTLEWHIENRYADIQYMGFDLFKVKGNNGKWGIVNKYGKTCTEIQYDSIAPFVEKRALLLSRHLLKGIVNELGETVNDFSKEQFVPVCHYSDGLLAYKDEKTGLYGYLSTDGNERIPAKYLWASPFSNGKASVQHNSKSKVYGIIDQDARKVITDNRTLIFISTPCMDTVLTVTAKSGRGFKVQMESIKDGKLDKIKHLESSKNSISITLDKKCIRCGEVEFRFDDAMRLVSSSDGNKYNKPLEISGAVSVGKSIYLSKKTDNEGTVLLYKGIPLLHTPFISVQFINDRYAVVRDRLGNSGVMKLNTQGNVSVRNTTPIATFLNSAKAKGEIVLNIEGVTDKTRIQIGINGIEKDGKETLFGEISGKHGLHSEEFMYFIPADEFNSKVRIPLIVNVYMNGMLYKREGYTLEGVHQEGYVISASCPEVSEPDGSSIIRFNVSSKNGQPLTGEVIIRGDANFSLKFDGEDSVKSIPVRVTVPSESVKTYNFTVTVKDNGCPSYTKRLTKTIRHYYHQSLY